MAGDRQGDRIPAHGAADGPRGAGSPDHPGNRAVARGLASSKLRHRSEDGPVPRRPVVEIKGDVLERAGVALEESRQCQRRCLEMVGRG